MQSGRLACIEAGGTQFFERKFSTSNAEIDPMVSDRRGVVWVEVEARHEEVTGCPWGLYSGAELRELAIATQAYPQDKGIEQTERHFAAAGLMLIEVASDAINSVQGAEVG